MLNKYWRRSQKPHQLQNQHDSNTNLSVSKKLYLILIDFTNIIVERKGRNIDSVEWKYTAWPKKSKPTKYSRRFKSQNHDQFILTNIINSKTLEPRHGKR